MGLQIPLRSFSFKSQNIVYRKLPSIHWAFNRLSHPAWIGSGSQPQFARILDGPIPRVLISSSYGVKELILESLDTPYGSESVWEGSKAFEGELIYFSSL